MVQPNPSTVNDHRLGFFSLGQSTKAFSPWSYVAVSFCGLIIHLYDILNAVFVAQPKKERTRLDIIPVWRIFLFLVSSSSVSRPNNNSCMTDFDFLNCLLKFKITA